MSDLIEVRREAARNALLLRRSLSVPREKPINVYDIATRIGVEVFFKDLPSLEGMFYRGPYPVIVLPSLKHRPRGRVTYSCAHELGHFQFNHGTSVDEYIEQPRPPKDPDEIAADTFAATLLMPRPAVLERFRCREWSIESADALQLYQAAIELDVGYTTLLTHLRFGLSLVSDDWVFARMRHSPKDIRRSLLPDVESRRIVIVDSFWPDVPIDVEVGDHIILRTCQGQELPRCVVCVRELGSSVVIRADRQGSGLLDIDSGRRAVRVAPAGFCGALKYRYVEAEDDE